MPKWGIFNALLFLNEHGYPSPLLFQNCSSHMINIQWTKFEQEIYCQFYFRGITLICLRHCFLGRVRLGYSGIYSSYSAPGSRIGGMEIQLFRNENSSQTNAYLHYSNYSYSGLIPNERALNYLNYQILNL